MPNSRKPSKKLKVILITENSRMILGTKIIHLIMQLRSTFQSSDWIRNNQSIKKETKLKWKTKKQKNQNKNKKQRNNE